VAEAVRNIARWALNQRAKNTAATIINTANIRLYKPYAADEPTERFNISGNITANSNPTNPNASRIDAIRVR
jgi:hypothetical protein